VLVNLRIRNKLLLAFLPLGADQIVLEVRSSLSQALEENPSDTDTIKSAATQFNQAVSWSDEARAAALRGDSHTATSRMQSQVDPQLEMVQQKIENLAGTLNQSIDKESDGLTEKMHRSIVLSWLFALLGLLATSGFALYIVQIELVKPLEKFRQCILGVADRRFEGPKAR